MIHQWKPTECMHFTTLLYTPICHCKSSNKFVTMLKGDYMSYYWGVNTPPYPRPGRTSPVNKTSSIEKVA